VYEFGSRPPEEFLREIDVFVYYHHPRWIEAFSRAMMEALAAGLPSILPPHFEAVFGDAAVYCAPRGVLGWIDRLRDPAEYLERSRRAAAFAKDYSHAAHVQRLAELGVVASGNRLRS
jgi:hypothetical protein